MINRRRLITPYKPDQAERLVFSESDLLSGLIVDRYASCLGVQFTSYALWRWHDVILAQLKELTHADSIMVRVEEKTALSTKGWMQRSSGIWINPAKSG